MRIARDATHAMTWNARLLGVRLVTGNAAEQVAPSGACMAERREWIQPSRRVRAARRDTPTDAAGLMTPIAERDAVATHAGASLEVGLDAMARHEVTAMHELAMDEHGLEHLERRPLRIEMAVLTERGFVALRA